MRTVVADILSFEQGVIVHQVNTRRVAGAGLARQIANRYPVWLNHYKNTRARLGDVDLCYVTSQLTIASVYAQDDFGTDRRYTDYAALGMAFCTLRDLAQRPPGIRGEIYVPYLLGCGLGGGEWEVVAPIVEDALPKAVIVRRPNVVAIKGD